jgi:hypothetical protein
MSGRNPRPCVCGHAPYEHRNPWCWRVHASGYLCPGYRPAPRTEPLRVLRNPVVIRPRWDDSMIRHVRQYAP